MKMIFKEIKEDIINFKIFSIFIIILTSILFTLISILINTELNVQNIENKHKNNLEAGNMYSLSDTLYGKEERLFMDSLNGLTILKNIYNDFKENFNNQYMSLHKQSLAIERKNKSEIFEYLYEEGKNNPEGYEEGYEVVKGEGLYKSYKAIQLDHSMYKFAKLDIEEGAELNKEDFNRSKYENTPVLLGIEYKRYYEIGDKIKVDYLGKLIEVQVKGFLKENEHILLNESEDYTLNRYILLPVLSDLEDPTNEEEYNFQQRHFLNLINGNIQTNRSEIDIDRLIVSITEKYNFPKIVIMGMSNQSTINLLHSVSKSKELLMIVIGAFTMIFITSIILVTVMKLDLSKEKWMVHMLSGAKRKDILLYIGGQFTLLVTFPAGIVFAIVSLKYKILTINTFMYFIVFLTAIIIIPIFALYIVLKRYNLNNLLQGDE